jgi:hypothetical protein
MPFIQFILRNKLNTSAHTVTEGISELLPLAIVHGAKIGATLNDSRYLGSVFGVHYFAER